MDEQSAVSKSIMLRFPTLDRMVADQIAWLDEVPGRLQLFIDEHKEQLDNMNGKKLDDIVEEAE